MKVLWFEVSIPNNYKGENHYIGGWQDALERIVKPVKDIELYISFETNNINDKVKTIDGVTYIPMFLSYTKKERHKNKQTWEVTAQKLEKAMSNVVKEVNPDIIHVFGTEWPFGRIAKYTVIPVVVHIMGSILPYMNALYPPGISFRDSLAIIPWWNIKKRIERIFAERKKHTWEDSELQVWKNVKYYMGRTEWDRSLSNIMHPQRKYFHVDEALRPDFISPSKEWKGYNNTKLRLITTGCSTFWKGPDMLLKTAKILKQSGIDFEWIVAGKMNDDVKTIVQSKLNTTFEKEGVNLIGMTPPSKLMDLLCSSTLYVHTAYIENSPNSICEAQCLGVPIISTNVGGISTLIKDGVHGVLVPANDPWQMANAILELNADKVRMKEYSCSSLEFARKRHCDENIRKQLLECYNNIQVNADEN